MMQVLTQQDLFLVAYSWHGFFVLLVIFYYIYIGKYIHKSSNMRYEHQNKYMTIVCTWVNV